MAKSIRSKVKKANRSKMRKIIGEPLKRKQILKTTMKLRKRLAKQSSQFMIEEARTKLNPDDRVVTESEELGNSTSSLAMYPSADERSRMSLLDKRMWKEMKAEEEEKNARFSFKDFVSSNFNPKYLQSPSKPIQEDEDIEEESMNKEERGKLEKEEGEKLRKEVDKIIPSYLFQAPVEGRNKHVVRSGMKAAIHSQKLKEGEKG